MDQSAIYKNKICHRIVHERVITTVFKNMVLLKFGEDKPLFVKHNVSTMQKKPNTSVWVIYNSFGGVKQDHIL